MVDRATLTVQEMMTQNVSEDPKNLLRNAKAVMVCPRIFKAGFFFGGEGGNCVLLARAGNGTWSYPAFYTIGSGSFGFQFGIEDNQLLMLIMTEKGLNAVLDSQIKLGANAGDRGRHARRRRAGLDDDRGRRRHRRVRRLPRPVRRRRAGGQRDVHRHRLRTSPITASPTRARQLVMQMQGGNPGADPLRDVLTRYGSRARQRPRCRPSRSSPAMRRLSAVSAAGRMPPPYPPLSGAAPADAAGAGSRPGASVGYGSAATARSTRTAFSQQSLASAALAGSGSREPCATAGSLQRLAAG